MQKLPTYVVDTRQLDSDNLMIRVGFCRFKVCADSYEGAVQQIKHQYPHLDALESDGVSDVVDFQQALSERIGHYADLDMPELIDHLTSQFEIIKK